MGWGASRAGTPGCSAGHARCGTCAGNTSTNLRSLAYAVIAIDIGNVIRSGIFVDPLIIEHRRVIDPVSIDGHSENAYIRRRRIDGPRNCD